MPCRDDGADEFYFSEKNNELKKRNDELAELLCYACRKLEYGSIPLDAELQAWWDNHKRQDQERHKKAQQKTEHLASVKTRLLTQLTAEEKEALGLSQDA